MGFFGDLWGGVKKAVEYSPAGLLYKGGKALFGGGEKGPDYLSSGYSNLLKISPEEVQGMISNLQRQVGTTLSQQENRLSDHLGYARVPEATRISAKNQAGYNSLLATERGIFDIEQYAKGVNRDAYKYLLGMKQRQDMADDQKELMKWQMFMNLLSGAGSAVGPAAAGGGQKPD